MFETNQKMDFTPGQYLEWTLEHPDEDSRGIRRYFTIASSPTEDTFRIGIKFYPHPSTFKQALLGMKEGSSMVASGLSGDFVLLVVISCVIAFPIAYYSLDQWLQKYKYHTEISWSIFIAVCVSAIAIALITVSYQSVRAALTNPVKSLRME